ncbi:MAG: glycoside hydrolase family 18 protein [Acidobacteriota bacterium]|nr:glycoside hydrolase family 18 protein [Acidobacteriota bacterium]
MSLPNDFPISRRRFLLAGAGGLASLADSSRCQGRGSRPGRLLFNCDGSMIHCWGRAALPQNSGPLSRREFTDLVFTPIENSGVDTLLFSFGSGNVAEYQSNVLEWPGEADRFQFPESRTWHGGIEVDPKDQYLNPKSLADSGHNPPQIIVDECRRRGLRAFVSLRMNDIHDGQHPRGTLPNPELPTFKRINPDWLVPDLDWWSALNFEVAPVRELKLRVIEEFFDRWDFDGIELDWLRHTFYFPRGLEREKGKYLTEFMRAVRRSLRQKAAIRGRPIEIAVRVPERVEWCLEGGFEVPTWIREGLADTLILGQGLTESRGLSGFRELMGDRRLPIYPSLYPFGNGYALYPDEAIRGSAANLWRGGADGLYTFNWFFYGKWRSRLLGEIADPALLRDKDKRYTLVQRFEAHRTGRSPRYDSVRFNTMIKAAPLPFTLGRAGASQTVTLPIADEISSASSPPRRAELLVGLEGLPGDVLELTLNGRLLEPEELDAVEDLARIECHLVIPPSQGILGFPPRRRLDMDFDGLRLQVPVARLTRGDNQLRLRLKQRRPGADRPVRVSRIELSVGYGSG